MNEAYLMHHGVKGMKWGVRRTKPSTGDSRGSSKTPVPSKPKAKKGMSKAAKIAAGAAVATVSAAVIDQVAFKGAGRKFIADNIDDLLYKTVYKEEYEKGYALGRALAEEMYPNEYPFVNKGVSNVYKKLYNDPDLINKLL